MRHRLSTDHVKNIKLNLLKKDFSSLCLVCVCKFKNLKDVESHVQGEVHRKKLDNNGYTKSDRYTCCMCGVAFYNQVALEVHCLMHSSHENMANSSKSLVLQELLKQLSGLPGDQSIPIVSTLCPTCNVEHDSLETLIKHLFTSAHVSCLRLSRCIVCKKNFTHADNSEEHLRGHKHKSTINKCRNPRDEVRRYGLSKKGGYPCMLCMVWCSSWLCLELHLRGCHHTNNYCQLKTKHSALAKIKFTILEDAEDGPVNVCDSFTAGTCSNVMVNNTEACQITANKQLLLAKPDNPKTYEDARVTPQPCLFDQRQFTEERCPAEGSYHATSDQFAFTGLKRVKIEEGYDRMLTKSRSCGPSLSKSKHTQMGFASSIDLQAETYSITSWNDDVEVGVSRDMAYVIEDRSSLQTNENGKEHNLYGRRVISCPKNVSDDVVKLFTANATTDGSSNIERCSNIQKFTIEVDGANFRMPVVVATSLAPLGTLQKSLCSVLTTVRKALSAALPMHMQQSAPSVVKGMKCEHERDEETFDDQPSAKKICVEEDFHHTEALDTMCVQEVIPYL